MVYLGFVMDWIISSILVNCLLIVISILFIHTKYNKAMGESNCFWIILKILLSVVGLTNLIDCNCKSGNYN